MSFLHVVSQQLSTQHFYDAAMRKKRGLEHQRYVGKGDFPAKNPIVMLFKEEGLSSFFSFSAPPSQGWGEEAPQPPPWPLSLWSDVSCRRGSWWLLVVFPSCEEGSGKQLFQQPKQPLGGGGRWNCGSSAPNGSSSAGCCRPTTE